MNQKPTNIKDLPSPKGHPITGHLPQFKTENKHQVLERWADECGELFKIRLVTKEFVVSTNPEFNSEVLKMRPDKFRRFSKIDEIFTEMGINGVFNAEGEKWKRHRKPISEALNAKNVKGFYPTIVSKTEALLSKFEQLAKKGSPVGVQKEFMGYTIDITTAIAFGYEMDTINNKADIFQEHLETIFPMINKRITAPIPSWRYLKNSKDKRLDSALIEIESLISEFIQKAKDRLASDENLRANPSNFLEALLMEVDGISFSDEEIFGNLFTMMLAGEDTTSNSISWAIFYLSQHPEIVQKLRQEALAVYPDSRVPNNYDHFPQLRYAYAVANEAIRIKPTTPQLYMEAIEDVTVDGLRLPQGKAVILQHKLAQNDEMYFTNADNFEPERWLKGQCPAHYKHDPKVIKAFGGGPRFCPGMSLAMHEMVVLLSSISKHFDFELATKPEEVTEQFAFTMHPGNLFVNFKVVSEPIKQPMS